ncbi:hypothetical protein EG329_004730 [Mollisiaceae sp. DMI_Dod_QoI]|nr:hypothetical protein EG329_004730 [Helotiales sp. DMI_Dod_QoI]
MPSPIRVGLIGLGRHTGTNVPGLWGAKVHLPYLLASPKYQVTAIANSTIESAQAAIDTHNLGPDVKAYGSPEDIAKDPNVDMVIVSVKVGAHYALSKPALLAGKSVFVEWPLGSSTEESEELAQLAKAHGSKTIVGLQARASPLVIKIKELISSGKIGKVLSSTVISSFGGVPPFGTWPEGAEYYLDMNSGSNQFVVYFGHFLDSFVHVLGDFKSLKSSLRTDYPTTDIVDASGAIITKNHPKTSPDNIQLQGTLESGASVSIAYYTFPGPAIDGTGIRWMITGTEGQIEITTPEMQWQMGPPGTVLKVRLGREKEVEVVDFENVVGEEQAVKKMNFPGVNTARLYQAFVDGKMEVFPDFKDAVKTHRLLDWIRREAGW